MFSLLCINCDFFSLIFLIVALRKKQSFFQHHERIKIKIVLYFFLNMRSKIPAFRSILLCPVQLFLKCSLCECLPKNTQCLLDPNHPNYSGFPKDRLVIQTCRFIHPKFPKTLDVSVRLKWQ